MVPPTIISLDEWPLMPNGNIDRRALPDTSDVTETNDVEGPRDPLELQLQLIFERVLKRAPIGIDVSFFELGGDSLQALELLVEIERSTGKNLPMGTLYQSSTVESLAREIRRRAGNPAWSSLVPLQVTGSRPPFFLLHTTPGDILGYGNLVYRLDADQPCYGFQSLGLLDGQCHTSIEEMSQYYVQQLKQFQPRGPYYLGGWCYGGIVAVEMARILHQEGEKIGLLALLETVAMPPAGFNFQYYKHRLQCIWSMTPYEWGIYVREKIKYARDSRLANRMRFRQVDGSNRVSPDGQILDPRLAQLEQVYNTNLHALNKYRSRYYEGKVTLFNAADRDPAVIPDPQYGWLGLAREIEIHHVPGNHDTMLTEPNVAVLSQQIGDALRQAQSKFEQAKS
jgi:thioesterase domain-containing protein/acyl carrier protein